MDRLPTPSLRLLQARRLVTAPHEKPPREQLRRRGQTANAIRKQLDGLDWSTALGFNINGLKREELVAVNSMLLHELYFGTLGGDGVSMVPAMKLALEANFGTLERWRSEFVAMGKALAGGSGWVLLTFMPRDGTLMNQWAADHTHALAGGIPILALDMYEHAYHLDFGAAAASYVDAFMGNIGWAPVYERYKEAVHGASEPFGADADQLAGVLVLNVRRAGTFEQLQTLIPGPAGMTPPRSPNGRATRPPTGPSWSIASTAMRSAVPPPCGYVRKGCRRATCAAGSTAGTRGSARSNPKEERHEIGDA